ncbi:MAG: tRNA dihydrouridine(20/20a) synthase DusA [Pseudomonadota bacterium]
MSTVQHTIAAPTGYRFAVAPMIDWTDRYCRFFHRQLSQHALLYTEMVTAEAVLRGDQEHLLGFDHAGPVALQLGGSDPEKLAKAATIGAAFGYAEINLNVGCPSDRVQSGRFGACLMREPELVAACLVAMREAVDVPVTAKCRIGIDDQDPERALPVFLQSVEGAGVHSVTIHARKAWLQGLSPKENRTIPPLHYDLVFRMKDAFPGLLITLNGGLPSPIAAHAFLDRVDGVMLGRAAYEKPATLTQVDRLYFDEANHPVTPQDAVVAVVQKAQDRDVPIWRYARHMLGLFAGQKGARAWRRRISEEARLPGARADLLLRLMKEEGLDDALSSARAAE